MCRCPDILKWYMYFEVHVVVLEITQRLENTTKLLVIEFRTRQHQLSQETNHRPWRLPKWMTAEMRVFRHKG